MKYKAVIFDLDGTLLDTVEDLADSVNMVLENMGFPTYETEKYKYFVGDGLWKLLERTLPPEKQDEATIASCSSQFLKIYGNRIANKTKPYKGIPELLDELDRRGVKKAILSNKPHSATIELVEKLLSNWKFEAVFGERPGVPKKPNPASALEIMGIMGAPVGQTLYLGDTSVDMKTANAADVYAVGVLWGFRGADELLSAGAKVLIEKPADLLKIL